MGVPHVRWEHTGSRSVPTASASAALPSLASYKAASISRCLRNRYTRGGIDDHDDCLTHTQCMGPHPYHISDSVGQHTVEVFRPRLHSCHWLQTKLWRRREQPVDRQPYAKKGLPLRPFALERTETTREPSSLSGALWCLSLDSGRRDGRDGLACSVAQKVAFGRSPSLSLLY